MKFSIQTKILVLSLSSTLIGTLSLGILSTLFISKTTQRNSMQYMRDQANSEAAKLNNLFESHEKYTMAAAAGVFSQIKDDSTFLTNPNNLSRNINGIRERLKSTISSLSNTKSVFVRFNPDITHSSEGVYLVRNPSNGMFENHATTNIKQYSPSDVEHVGWYYKPIMTGNPIWLPPYYNKNINAYIISYVIPMFLDNKEIGVAGIDIDFDGMTKQLSQVHFMQSGFAFLEDSEGFVLYHPTLPNGLTFKPEEDQIMLSTPLINGMNLVTVAPILEINAQRNRHIRQSIIFILLLLAFTTAITIFFSRSITKPLKELTKEAKKMITGDMNAEFNIKQNDEIGELAKSFAAAKFHIIQHMKQMQGLAFQDSLTGVRNKMAYDSYLSELKDRIERGEVKSYGIAVLDTNNLKEINDTYGHENGNAYLVNSCKLICQIFTHSPVFRIGGDEFLVVLTGRDLENHSELMTQLKESMDLTKNASFPWKQISIACGLGIASYAKGTTIEETFNKADKNMYINKREIKIAEHRPLSRDEETHEEKHAESDTEKDDA
ncbi:diguanylate cyclase [Fibrobacter succinogenes subsp. succinogenes S85]|uniref:diguanylate cyclase n=1 Tax=Fibrobacter succinogenes (strain ATCC 19169 / S85) TaxID=59374 RepID=A0ABN3YY45_FIBSS|nr:diguanylate cyclase [Fibrobacter succinogenes]ACX75336.1 diguanylate cyclase [Fibrobacter succinogenes subsp. succinogenes S85]